MGNIYVYDKTAFQQMFWVSDTQTLRCSTINECNNYNYITRSFAQPLHYVHLNAESNI